MALAVEVTPPKAWLSDDELVARTICQARAGCPCLIGFPCVAHIHDGTARQIVETLRANHRLIRPPAA